MQVFVGDKMVGVAKLATPPHGRQIVMHILKSELPGIDNFNPGYHAPNFDRVTMNIAQRHLQIAEMDIAMAGDSYIQKQLDRHGVDPHLCTVEQDITRDMRRYSWKIISIDQEIHELIFDQDWFEPADTEIDYEARMEMQRRVYGNSF